VLLAIMSLLYWRVHRSGKAIAGAQFETIPESSPVEL